MELTFILFQVQKRGSLVEERRWDILPLSDSAGF
jgi:hypothetical protein